jgi:hypothetical protein
MQQESLLPVAAHHPSSPAPEPVRYARCVVLADGVETLYRRAGRGAAVLVLGPTHSLGAALLDTLPLEFRVLVPELPSPTPSFCDWLRGFLDGLGLSSVCIIAERDFVLAALGFALVEPTRVERIVVLVDGHPESELAIRQAPEHLDSAGHPLLITRNEILDSRHTRPAVEQVSAFLRG